MPQGDIVGIDTVSRCAATRCLWLRVIQAPEPELWAVEDEEKQRPKPLPRRSSACNEPTRLDERSATVYVIILQTWPPSALGNTPIGIPCESLQSNRYNKIIRYFHHCKQNYGARYIILYTLYWSINHIHAYTNYNSDIKWRRFISKYFNRYICHTFMKSWCVNSHAKLRFHIMYE